MSVRLTRGLVQHTRPPHPGWARTDPLDQGLVGEWRFDPVTGLMVPDYSGYGARGQIENATGLWTGTQYGPAYNFGGAAGENAACGARSQHQVQDHTVEIFFHNPDDDPMEYGLLSRLNAITTDGYKWNLRQASGNTQVRFAYYDGAIRGWYSSFFLTIPGWTHFIGTWSPGAASVSFYLNGGLNRSLATTGNDIIHAANAILRIADEPQFADEFPDKIALVRLYNRALSASEVAKRYEQVLRRGQEPVSLWPMPRGFVAAAPPATIVPVAMHHYRSMRL